MNENLPSQGLVSALAGEEAGEQWNDVSGYLFEILGTFLALTLGYFKFNNK